MSKTKSGGFILDDSGLAPHKVPPKPKNKPKTDKKVTRLLGAQVTQTPWGSNQTAT